MDRPLEKAVWALPLQKSAPQRDIGCLLSKVRNRFCCIGNAWGGPPMSCLEETLPDKPDLSIHARCANPNCPCPAAFDGKHGSFCSKTCAGASPDDDLLPRKASVSSRIA
eukprot:5489395-Amphidinium_carterae.1